MSISIRSQPAPPEKSNADQTPTWTTPRLYQAALMSIWVTAFLFFAAAIAGVRASRSAVQTIGKDAVPSILAAEKLKVSLSDLDADVVNELIVPPGSSASSIKGYVERRQEITASLILAAENITYGDLERKPITDLTNALSAFERLAIKARTLHDHGDEPGAVTTYRDALAQLHNQLLPAADALAKANQDALDRRGAELSATTNTTIVLTQLTGILLIAALITTQLFISQRSRRTLNVPLVAATAASALTLLLLLRTFGDVQKQVTGARNDAFASLSALWQARAVAYDSNADESRWLFDRDRRPELETAFFDKNAQILKPATGITYASIASATQAPSLPPGTQGFLAQEMGNITYPGEADAAQNAIRAFGVYFAKDAAIRADENSGNHAEAVRVDVSMSQGDSNWAFSQFDDALGKTIDINQQAFDSDIAEGFKRLSGWDYSVPIVVLFIGSLALAGIRPRIREYDL